MSASFDNCAVKIAVRELPTRERPENGGSDVIVYHSASSNILIVDERPFVFDYVFSPEITQQKLFDDLIKPLVVKVLQGFSCSALAYGQTGTGKSYTMGLNSNQNFEGENVGVIPRCFREIFNSDDNNENLKTLQNRVIHASFVEIYNEKVYDLLADNSTEPIFARGCKFTGGTRKKITNLLECCCILNQGNKNRHVRPTKMNSQSSRSHAIFTIHVQAISIERTISSCLNLVDLAGSEGVRRTGHQGVAMSEGVHINQGLLSIGKVLQALASGLKVIPYRDSVLSSVLQDSLNPNSYLTLVACISPLREDLSETLSTLRFAQNAKQLKHSPQINTILTEIKKNKVKTPYNSNVLQNRTAATTPNNNPYYRITTVTKSGIKANGDHRHTFCTPSKMKNVNRNKFNQTEMGLTTKEKQKISKQHQPAQKNPLSTVSNQIVFNRDSTFDKNNDTIESRSSLFSLNISSSTTVDASSINPPNNQVISFSPIIRKCLNECEKIMESKMEKIIETFKNVQHSRDLSNYTYGTDITLYANTPASFEGSVQPMPSVLRQEFRHIVKEIFEHSDIAQRSIDKDQIDLTSLTISPKKQNVKCQLFATSSPVFKVPAVPQLECENSLTENFSKLDSRCADGEATNFFSHGMEETIQNNIVRRSLRLSTRKLNDSMLSENSLPKARRRSRRLNSIKEINDEKRRSIRVASLENSLEFSMNKTEKPKRSSNKNKKVLDNSVISSYFDTTNWENKSSKKLNIAKHKKAILELLNKGSMKNLQLLPQIGQKTAYQLVTQRTLNGKFKSLAQVEKLPVWRGNAWTRFAEANMLL